MYEGFELDDVLHTPTGADVHFSVYVPASYVGTVPHALFVTLPGWEGLYFQGVGENLRWEKFWQESRSYMEDMIVLAPQLGDWGRTSASQTIELVEHFLDVYSIDSARVFIEGLSGGGETLSYVLEMRPELFAAALAVSSQWDGDLASVAEARTPLRLFTGRDDSYYGSESFIETAGALRGIYREQGLADAEIDELIVLDVRETDYFEARGYTDQHMGGASAAFEEEVMGWLFSRRR